MSKNNGQRQMVGHALHFPLQEEINLVAIGVFSWLLLYSSGYY